MLVTPRLYQLSQVRDKGLRDDYQSQFHALTGWRYRVADYQHAADMLLVHQTGSVKVGEVVRYTLTYTPSADRILPAPTHLYVKVKNTSAIPLRAAYLHGPYTLYAACYPSTFHPDHKHENYATEGSPEYEPNLKAGGQWTTKLTVPETVREAAGGPKSRQSLDGHPRSFKWVIEVSSQVLFSTTATVHYEMLVGRDERSIELGFHGIAATTHGAAGRLEDHQKTSTLHVAQAKGVYSKAVRLLVEDTETLWNKPAFPAEVWRRFKQAGRGDPDDASEKGRDSNDTSPEQTNASSSSPQVEHQTPKTPRKRVHLVILTHGLHSNVGSDMLYMKESIDASAREAREDARKTRAQRKAAKRQKNIDQQIVLKSEGASTSAPNLILAPTTAIEDDDSEDEEHVVVRGFKGNAVKTERGIQYLGKRLAKFVLSTTYPDQPFLPVKSSISKQITRSFTGQKNLEPGKQPAHKGSSIHRDDEHTHGDLPYQITSISFIAHSLGGLIQTYAIAYINKHSPEFFDLIKPINFVALASPFLGLSNENPLYVKFALDFGLVGSTGRDLGLTWRAPAAMGSGLRSGWGAMIGGLGKDSQKDQSHSDPGSKPLLRILPTGPAHSALKRFRNRTVYSNVVNDGIVPLRTSCLLFLDWRGLERVEKARRDMGLVGTMAGWGWAELTGQNASSPRQNFWNDIFSDNDDSDSNVQKTEHSKRDDVPQPAQSATEDDNKQNSEVLREPKDTQLLDGKPFQDEAYDQSKAKESSSQQPLTPWSGLLAIFKSSDSKSHHHTPKRSRIYQRGQTMAVDQSSESSDTPTSSDAAGTATSKRARPVRGSSLYTIDSNNEGLHAPPKTTFFEAAGDLINPPLPPKEFLLDPAARPRTIFHDRVYHPEDIPAPPVKKQRSIPLPRSLSLDSDSRSTNLAEHRRNDSGTSNEVATGTMKVEEKIARAYHHQLSWRKVLVRLEPDAHNNIIVRRMFANAYGWPVVKHLCDTHFGYTAAAQTDDELETNAERAKPMDEDVEQGGEHVKGQTSPPPSRSADLQRRKSADSEPSSPSESFKPKPFHRTESEAKEARDAITELKPPDASSSYTSSIRKQASIASIGRSDSARWSDRFFEGSDDDSDIESSLRDLANARGRRGSGGESAVPKVANVLSSSPEREKSLDLPSRPRETEGGDGDSSKAVPNQAALGLTGLGIGIHPNDRVSGPSEDSKEAHLGVSEQVAFAQSKKQDTDSHS